MKTFRDLIISGGTDKTRRELLMEIKNNLPKDWTLEKDLAEKYSKSTSKSNDDVICVMSPTNIKFIGFIWFGIWENSLRIRNIIPQNQGSLNYDSYNFILEEFANKCIEPVLKGDFKLVLTPNEYSLEAEAGEETAKLLEIWADSCNPSTLNSHPFDFERWAAFVISAHKNGSQLSTETLKRWLFEVKGWDRNFEKIHDLVLDYEYALRILEVYDKHR
jgi:hypothetical protein